MAPSIFGKSPLQEKESVTLRLHVRLGLYSYLYYQEAACLNSCPKQLVVSLISKQSLLKLRRVYVKIITFYLAAFLSKEHFAVVVEERGKHFSDGHFCPSFIPLMV